jgi:hypothetical protein
VPPPGPRVAAWHFPKKRLLRCPRSVIRGSPPTLHCSTPAHRFAVGAQYISRRRPELVDDPGRSDPYLGGLAALKYGLPPIGQQEARPGRAPRIFPSNAWPAETGQVPSSDAEGDLHVQLGLPMRTYSSCSGSSFDAWSMTVNHVGAMTRLSRSPTKRRGRSMLDQASSSLVGVPAAMVWPSHFPRINGG